ncbi:VOC family protein [Streptomyces sp. NBC_01477]|uniref:VOC family protein n=1 Tax=Streptomyces sp. NBC_01477 TaxID=2976015 RepID=UPI002E373C08|nr:VOC family protein [Streptomyces sp. NBC_01477]
MSGKIFVNLPVQDLQRSMGFFQSLGFRFDPQYTDERAACMVVSDSSFVMLLTQPFFASFTAKDVADATASTAVIVAVSQDAAEDVDRIGDAAIAAGAQRAKAAEDASPMHTRSFYDLDGHQWEIFHIPPTPA